MTVHRTIALDDTENARLEELAQYHGVSVTELMLESAQRIIEEDKAFLAAVQKGIDEIEAGHFLTHEEVVERAAARRQELLARAANK